MTPAVAAAVPAATQRAAGMTTVRQTSFGFSSPRTLIELTTPMHSNPSGISGAFASVTPMTRFRA